MWEGRAFASYDHRVRPTQLNRTVHGTKTDAKRVAAQLTVKPAGKAGASNVAELLDECVEPSPDLGTADASGSSKPGEACH